jgi:hypothetical protein
MNQLAAPFLPKHADHAKIDESNAVARKIKHVAGMRVRVEQPVHHDHFYHCCHPTARENLAVEPSLIESRNVATGNAADIFLHAHALAGPLPIDLGNDNDWK